MWKLFPKIQSDHPPQSFMMELKNMKVEHMLDSHVFRGKLEYLVWWKGYGIKEEEWRLSVDVKGVKRLCN